MNRQLMLLGVASVLLLGAFGARANMTVDRNVLYFTPGDPYSADVTVTNPGVEPLFIDVEVQEVLNAGSDDELRVPLNPGEDLPLLASPGKAVLAPGQQRLLRVVNLAGNGMQERVFRITLRPVPAPARAEQSGIRLLVAQQLLVIVSPREPRADLYTRRDGERLIIENRGNTNVLLHSGKQCAEVRRARGDDDCISFRGARLYPGNVWEVETPYHTPIQFAATETRRTARRTF